jgi:hypothetical protein
MATRILRKAFAVIFGYYLGELPGISGIQYDIPV